MSDFALTAAPVLDSYSRAFGETRLAEIVGMGIVSIAEPHGGRAALAAVMQEAYGCAPPEPGRTTRSHDGAIRFLGLARDQFLATFDEARLDAGQVPEAVLAGSAYTCLQSDNWVALRLSGPLAPAALERICPIDLHPQSFPSDAVARTVMEHMGAIVTRDGDDGFLLLSASSSAASFAHAVEISVRNVA